MKRCNITFDWSNRRSFAAFMAKSKTKKSLADISPRVRHLSYCVRCDSVIEHDDESLSQLPCSDFSWQASLDYPSGFQSFLDFIKIQHDAVIYRSKNKISMRGPKIELGDKSNEGRA